MTKTSGLAELHGGEVEWAVSERYNIPVSEITSYASTVSPIIPGSIKALAERFDHLHLYPILKPRRLMEIISAHQGTSGTNRVILGCGSTELIYLFAQVVCGGEVVIPVPTYGEYATAVSKYGGEPVFVSLTPDFDLDIPLIRRAISPRTKAIFVCNPNNPTGKLYPKNEMEELAEIAKERNLVLFVDEDYLCFAPESKKNSLTPLIESHPIFIVNSLSKFFGVPSIRLGWGVGSPQLISKLSDYKLPWVISNIAFWAGEELLTDVSYQKMITDLIDRERTGLLRKLREVNWLKVYPSKTNFLLFKILEDDLDAVDVFEKLVNRRMVIRNCSSMRGLSNRFLRATIRTAEDNQKLVSALKEVLIQPLASRS